MEKAIKRAISYSFYGLFLAVPLFLFPKTSEIFEFNKMVLVYAITIILSGLWLTQTILEKRFNFRRTPLDLPLVIFLSSQLLSTIFSLDPRTSLFGYYSRFHGGLLSSVSYSLLYWIFVSTMTPKDVIKGVKFLFSSTILVSFWGIFEHFGRSFSCFIFPEFGVFDVSCWVQDVKTRVFSSFGQPNWLAAWLTALIPLTWAFGIISISKSINFNNFLQNRSSLIKFGFFSFTSTIFFVTLLFTKSRSGLLAFAASFITFWVLHFWSSKKTLKSNIFNFTITLSILALTTLLVGTPWTPALKDLISKTTQSNPIAVPTGPALEVEGGTESGKIRQIVWRGAIDVWKNYPILGSGVETFAFSYYLYRPSEHNLVSEWDYLYNKAHNEYLNFAATTGTLGLLAYLILISSGLLIFYKNFQSGSRSNIKKLKSSKLLTAALVSGYISILVTNFFGFSTVAVTVLFFLFPAFSVTSSNKKVDEKVSSSNSLSTTQRVFFLSLLSIVLYLLVSVGKYWYTDYLYAKGRTENSSGSYESARHTLSEVIKRSPKESIYWDELAEATSSISLGIYEKDNPQTASSLANSAVNESKRAISLSPANVNLKRKMATRVTNLSVIDQNFLLVALNLLEEAVKQAPTDAKLFYNLSYAYLRVGNYDKAIKNMEKSVILKPDYERARYALGLMYIDVDEKEKAKSELRYILERLSPGNLEVQKELDDLEK